MYLEVYMTAKALHGRKLILRKNKHVWTSSWSVRKASSLFMTVMWYQDTEQITQELYLN